MDKRKILITIPFVFTIGIILFLFYVKELNPFYMNLFMEENESNRYDWIFNDSIRAESRLVYSIGRDERNKFHYVYDIGGRYYLYIYEIKEYSDLSLDKIDISYTSQIRKLNVSQGGYYGSPWLHFDSKIGSTKANKLNIVFSDDSKILGDFREPGYILLRTNFQSLMITNNEDDLHLNVYYEDNKIIPTDFLLLKKKDSFFLITIKSTNNKIFPDSTILKILKIK